MRIAVYAIFALSLELLVGATGLVSLGHAAFLGIGAYATVLASGDSGALARAARAAGDRRRRGVRRSSSARSACAPRGVYFIMVTLAFAQMAYFVFHDTKVGGGSDGIFLYAKPVLAIGGRDARSTSASALPFYYAVLAALVATYAFIALLLGSRFGHALAGIRVNEQRMRAAGFSTTPYKLAAFVIAGALAGLAGLLLAVKDGAVNPELLVLARIGRGAADADLRRHRQPARRGDRRDRVHAAEGAVPVGGAARAARLALAADARPDDHRLRRRAAARPDRPRRAPARRCVPAAPAAPGDRHERGAGRSPGRARPRSRRCSRRSASAGAFAAWPPSTRSRSTSARRRDPRRHRHQRRRQVDAHQHALGRARAERRQRSLRRPRRDALAAAAPRPRRPRPQLPAHDDLRRVQRARELPPRGAGERAAAVAGLGARRQRRDAASPSATRALAAAGLDGDAGRIAATLSHGAKRQLEIAMCLATAPRALLLDEPLAGMGAEETGRMLDAARGAEGRATRSCSSSTTWTRCSASPTASR